MLEILAPFLKIKSDHFPLGKCYSYFKSFMTKFFSHSLSSKFFNKEMGLPYTKFIMNISKLLLKYHCPEVSYVLTKFRVNLDFFMIPSVMTLFH